MQIISAAGYAGVCIPISIAVHPVLAVDDWTFSAYVYSMKKQSSKIGNLIRSYRLKLNMSQLELSERLGYNTSQFISNIERGLNKVPLETLGHFTSILEIPEKKVLDTLVDTYRAEVKSRLGAGKRSKSA